MASTTKTRSTILGIAFIAVAIPLSIRRYHQLFPTNPIPASASDDVLVRTQAVKRKIPDSETATTPRYRVDFNSQELDNRDLKQTLEIPDVVELGFWSCRLSSDAFKNCRADGQLKFIFVSQSEISPESYSEIGMMKSLSRIQVEGDQFDDDCLHAFCENASLESMHLIHNSLTKAGLSSIPRIRPLRDLTIDNDSLDAESVAALDECLPRLRELNLSGERIDSSIGNAIRKCHNLEVLHLTGTQVDDDIFPSVANLNALNTLFLGGSRVTKEGVEKFRDKHKNVFTIH